MLHPSSGKMYAKDGRVVDVAEAIAGSVNLIDGYIETGQSPLPLKDSEAIVVQVMIQSDPSNNDNIKVGNSESQSVILSPGDSYELTIADLNRIYIASDSEGQRINYHARGGE